MKWYVLYTRHHHERAVYGRLLEKGFEAYLPWTTSWRPLKRGLRAVRTPLFPRHVFVRCYLEMYAHLELISIPGVLRVLENAQGHLLVVPEEEIRALRKLSDAGTPLRRAEYPTQGEWVEVVYGHLRGIAGVIREGPPTTLLVPIYALHMGVAVEISRAQVTPCPNGGGGSRQTPLPPGIRADL